MERIMVYKNPISPVTEAYRALCTNVLAVLNEKKIMEIVSLANNSNVSIVIANLAVAMAQTGKKVLLIDCNLRNPQQHELFGLRNSGLSDCVSSGGYYKTFVKGVIQPNLFVLTAGTTTNNPAEILFSQTMQTILNEVKETYDMVLLDVPPADMASDAVALGTKIDGVLLLLINKQDKIAEAQKVKEMFTQAGVNILGCVLDKA